HTLVPAKYITEDGYNLTLWVRRQRRAYLHNKLLPEKTHILENLPPGWQWEPSDTKWLKGFMLLHKYVRQHGHTNVPKNYRENGTYLARWVRNTKIAYQSGQLLEYQKQMLQKLPGWTWNFLKKQSTPTAAGQ
ncbi:MAG: helicase associated domain-containing protein, partial [Planctomycetota bacterium]